MWIVSPYPQLKGPLKFLDHQWFHNPNLLRVPNVGESKVGTFGVRGLLGALALMDSEGLLARGSLWGGGGVAL